MLTIVVINTIRRPYTSESEPIIGETRNWRSENKEPIKPKQRKNTKLPNTKLINPFTQIKYILMQLTEALPASPSP